MATKKSADAFKYMTKDASPFWKKFREAIVVNPQSNTGIPDIVEGGNRWPQPGSRPEKYAVPASQASDPAHNPYYQRDFRRMYPRLNVVTQEDLTKLLLEAPQQVDFLPSPVAPQSSDSTQALTPSSSAPSLSAVLLSQTSTTSTTAAASSASAGYSPTNLPPSPPQLVGKTHVFRKAGPDAVPKSEFAYFPMENYV